MSDRVGVAVVATKGGRELLKLVSVSLLLILPVALGQVTLDTAQLAKRVSPTVVVIEGNTDAGAILGSGFIVSKDGKVVTNLHVVRDLKTATVRLASGETFDSVSVLATDQRRDLAIIQIAGFDLPILDSSGNSNAVSVGERVMVVVKPSWAGGEPSLRES